jgi:hypothetical protein
MSGNHLHKKFARGPCVLPDVVIKKAVDRTRCETVLDARLEGGQQLILRGSSLHVRVLTLPCTVVA